MKMPPGAPHTRGLCRHAGPAHGRPTPGSGRAVGIWESLILYPQSAARPSPAPQTPPAALKLHGAVPLTQKDVLTVGRRGPYTARRPRERVRGVTLRDRSPALRVGAGPPAGKESDWT